MRKHFMIILGLIILIILPSSYGFSLTPKAPIISITQPNLQQNLRQAVKENNLTAIQACLKQPITSYEGDTQQITALMQAAKDGNDELVQILLTNPNITNLADEINKVDKNGSSALIHATLGGHEKVVELLLEHHADLNIRNAQGMTAAMLATSLNYLNILKMLIEKDTDQAKQTNLGYTLVMYAAQHRHLDTLKFLMSIDKIPINRQAILADFLMAAASGQTEFIHQHLNDSELLTSHKDAYHYNIAGILAAANGHAKIVEVLLTKSDAKQMFSGWNIVMHAICHNHDDLVPMLLSKMQLSPGTRQDMWFKLMRAMTQQKAYQIPKTTKDIILRSPVNPYAIIALQFAIATNNIEIVRFLLTEKCIEASILDQYCLLVFPALQGYDDIIQLLLQHGTDINGKNFHGINALMAASRIGHESTVKQLLENQDLQIDAVDNNNNNALMLAVSAQKTKIVSLLLPRINLNQQNILGKTALMLAYLTKNTELVTMLTQAGADTSLTDKQHLGLCYYKIAAGGIEAIKQFNLDIHKTYEHGYTMLMFAALNNNQQLVEHLLAQNVAVNPVNDDGDNALLLAIKFNNPAIALLLCQKTNIPIQHSNKDNMNALMLAAVQGHIELVTYLLPKTSNLNQQDNIRRRNVLMHATLNGRKEIVALLSGINKNTSQEQSSSETSIQQSIAAMDCSQAMILARIKTYLRAKHAAIPWQDKDPKFEEHTQDFFKSFARDYTDKIHRGCGHCHGITILWLYFQYLQNQNIHAAQPDNPSNWFYATIALILTKINTTTCNLKDLTTEEQLDIDRFINFIKLLQDPLPYLQVFQKDPAIPLKALNETIDWQKEYSITTFCSQDQLANLLADSKIMQPQKMIYIGANRHATALFCTSDINKNITVYPFNSNRFTISAQPFTGNMQDLAKWIFSAHGLNPKLDILSILVYSLGQQPAPNYPAPAKIIAKIYQETKFSSEQQQNEILREIISEACIKGDHESLHYFLNITRYSHNDKDIAYIADAGCQKSARVMLDFIQQHAGGIIACDAAIAMLLRACKHHHSQLIDFILAWLQQHNQHQEYIKNKFQESTINNQLNGIIKQALTDGHFEIIDKIFLYFANASIGFEMYRITIILQKEIIIKYLIHFNLYGTNNINFLISTKDNKDDLPSLRNITQLLNTLNRKTKLFLLKYIQSITQSPEQANLWYGYGKNPEPAIKQIEQAIINSDADTILNILEQYFKVKPGVITKPDLEAFLAEQ